MKFLGKEGEGRCNIINILAPRGTGIFAFLMKCKCFFGCHHRFLSAYTLCILPSSSSPFFPLSNKPLDRLDDAAVEPPSAWLITYSTEGLAQLRVAVDPAVQGGYG